MDAASNAQAASFVGHVCAGAPAPREGIGVGDAGAIGAESEELAREGLSSAACGEG